MNNLREYKQHPPLSIQPSVEELHERKFYEKFQVSQYFIKKKFLILLFVYIFNLICSLYGWFYILIMFFN